MNHIVGHGFCGVMAWLLVLSIGLPEDTNTALAAGPPDTVDALELPVPRTFELAHVAPEHFAVALGKDPKRIFAFVRDQIAYKVYAGYLRGPRGTLLALAGNSVDQAALLDSMLRHAGHRVRYVRGTLSESEAKKLVDSMWAERPRPAPAESELTPEVEAALETLRTGVERDYNLIVEHLKRSGHAPDPEAGTHLDALIAEARSHYWVQWWKDGTWIDLDPSFGEASIGKAFAGTGAPFAAFPEELFHRVEIRVHLEEYTGEARSERVILRHSAKAAELTGIHLGLIHMPENWKGPALTLVDALSAAIMDTGRIKPVLIIEAEVDMGEPFRQTAPPQTGLGSITNLLAGAGTRQAVAVATAEWIEFDFIYPDGQRKKVAREIFDLLGQARRELGQGLTSIEVRERTEGESAFDLTLAVYHLLVTTGRVDAAHLPSGLDDGPTLDLEDPDFLTALWQFSTAFITTSDALLSRLEWPQEATVILYPDSPRLVISEFATAAETARVSLDLRRTGVRAATRGRHPEYAFAAQMYHGVVEGTLERVLMELVTAVGRANGDFGPVMSTSTLFEQVQAKGIPVVVLSDAHASLGADVPKDALARLRGELSGGYIAVVPQRALPIDGRPRLAWWRIDRRSGETTAVMDDGLHPTIVAYVQHQKRSATSTVTVRQTYVGGKVVSRTHPYSRAVYNKSYYASRGFAGGIRELNRDIGILRRAGVKIVTGRPPPLP